MRNVSGFKLQRFGAIEVKRYFTTCNTHKLRESLHFDDPKLNNLLWDLRKLPGGTPVERIKASARELINYAEKLARTSVTNHIKIEVVKDEDGRTAYDFCGLAESHFAKEYLDTSDYESVSVTVNGLANAYLDDGATVDKAIVADTLGEDEDVESEIPVNSVTKQIAVVETGAFAEGKVAFDDDLSSELGKVFERLVHLNGIQIDGVRYFYVTTSSGGLKKGVSYFVSAKIWNKFSVIRQRYLDVGCAMGITISKWLQNVGFEFTPCCKYSSVDSSILDKAAVVDKKALEKWTKENFVVSENVAGFPSEEERKTNRSCCYKVNSGKRKIQYNPIDGYTVFNYSFFKTVKCGDKVIDLLNHSMQFRIAMIKGFGQVVDIRALVAKMEKLGKEADPEFVMNYMIPCIEGGETVLRDIRECSMIITSDVLKGYEAYKNMKFANLKEFCEYLGWNGPRMMNLFGVENEKHEKIGWTTQFNTFIVHDKKTGKVITEAALEDLKRTTSVTDEATDMDTKIKIAKQAVAIEAFDKLFDLKNGAFVYTDYVSRKIDQYHYAKYSDAQRKWNIPGRSLKAAPDLIMFIGGLLGYSQFSLCGDTDGVYCMSMKSGNVVLTRNPVQGYDVVLTKNLYDPRSPWNEFLSPNIVYFGFSTTAAKFMNCDFDGDTVNIIDDERIVEIVEKTNKTLNLQHIAYFDDKDAENITDPELRVSFADAVKDEFAFASLSAGCVSASMTYTKYVGICASIICFLGGYINKLVSQGRITEAKDIYLHDVVPMAQMEQLAVDACKTLVFLKWDKEDSCVVNHVEDFYLRKYRMPHKEYNTPLGKDHFEKGISALGHYKSELEHDVDANGWEQSETTEEAWMKAPWMAYSNVALMHDIISEEVPAHVFWTREVKGEVVSCVRTECLNEMQRKYPFTNTMFNGGAIKDHNYDVVLTDEIVKIIDKYSNAKMDNDSKGRPVTFCESFRDELNNRRITNLHFIKIVKRIMELTNKQHGSTRPERQKDAKRIFRLALAVAENKYLYSCIVAYLESTKGNGLRLEQLVDLTTFKVEKLEAGKPVVDEDGNKVYEDMSFAIMVAEKDDYLNKMTEEACAQITDEKEKENSKKIMRAERIAHDLQYYFSNDICKEYNNL